MSDSIKTFSFTARFLLPGGLFPLNVVTSSPEHPMPSPKSTEPAQKKIHPGFQRAWRTTYFGLISASLCVLTACTQKKNAASKDGAGQTRTPNSGQAVAPRSSTEGLLDVAVKLREDGLLLAIKNAPKGSAFECEIGNQPLSPCHDGAILPKPLQDGDYSILVDAMIEGRRVATGASQTFTITRGSLGTTTDDPNHPLALRFTETRLRFGMTAPKAKDFVLSFALVRPLACAQPTFRCRLDTPISPFWTVCDQSGKSFTIKSALIAFGPQDVGIQASCGENVGPVLNLRWYGVPDDYQEMQLQDLTDGQGRHLVELMRDIDCPREKRRYECSSRDENFTLCANANQLTYPASDFKIRMNCEGRIGPTLVLRH